MSTLLCALVLVAQQPAQASFPLPPGPAPDHFGLRVAVDDDRALVGSIQDGDFVLWSYRRIGTDWTPEAPFPSAALDSVRLRDFLDSSLELDGDLAIVGASGTELVFDGTAWVVTDQLPGRVQDVDLDAGVAIGWGPATGGGSYPILVAHRTPSGWQADGSFAALPEASRLWTDLAIEGGVAVIGNATATNGNGWGFWGGILTVIERDPVSSTWSRTAEFFYDDDFESLLGASVDVSGGTVYATARGRIEAYERSAGGGWVRDGSIDPVDGWFALPSPISSWAGEPGSLARPLIDGDVAVVRIRASAAPAGEYRLQRLERSGTNVWHRTGEYATSGAADCTIQDPTTGSGQVSIYGVPAAYRLHGAADGPLGILAAKSSPTGCLVGVEAFEPVAALRTCAGQPTSLGAPAELDIVGSFFRADARTTFVAWDLPPLTYATPLFSFTSGFTPTPIGSQGDLCLGEPITRLLAHSSQADAAGHFEFDVDVDTGLAGLTIPLGTPTYFQLWFRDVSSTGQATSNFTNGVLMRAW